MIPKEYKVRSIDIQRAENGFVVTFHCVNASQEANASRAKSDTGYYSGMRRARKEFRVICSDPYTVIEQIAGCLKHNL
jgi:hypothetical protein